MIIYSSQVLNYQCTVTVHFTWSKIFLHMTQRLTEVTLNNFKYWILKNLRNIFRSIWLCKLDKMTLMLIFLVHLDYAQMKILAEKDGILIMNSLRKAYRREYVQTIKIFVISYKLRTDIQIMKTVFHFK